MKQTAVEWLINELTMLGHNFKLYNREINQAKQMEKEQHNDTWTDSIINISGVEYIGKEKHFEQYYKETYGGNDRF